MPLAPRFSQPPLTESVKPRVAVENVQRLVCDDRRQADRSTDRSLALDGAIVRIDVDQGALRADHDQTPAGEHRPAIENRPGLFLLVAETGQLRDPANFAAAARDGDQSCIVGDDKGPVADNP